MRKKHSYVNLEVWMRVLVHNMKKLLILEGDIFGAHQSNHSMPLLCIWKQYCQCFSGWNCQIEFSVLIAPRIIQEDGGDLS
ncbi:uncharacterized protein LOC106759624 isoform X3 [Vigna radiata var. radiata]|uniref:Uncharacterized protein LOC106759624 isoform X3 n=1 Tax=Vigna radiata var. radiata TaxID=3916 RepID=A0A3Q0EYW2_VIGRR|nr:uncharacterized protein LOC106759624 isoform X3 [Vigna radiata var. radiata]